MTYKNVYSAQTTSLRFKLLYQIAYSVFPHGYLKGTLLFNYFFLPPKPTTLSIFLLSSNGTIINPADFVKISEITIYSSYSISFYAQSYFIHYLSNPTLSISLTRVALSNLLHFLYWRTWIDTFSMVYKTVKYLALIYSNILPNSLPLSHILSFIKKKKCHTSSFLFFSLFFILFIYLPFKRSLLRYS